MSEISADPLRRPGAEARALMARAADTEARARMTVRGVLADFADGEEARVDERTRVGLAALVETLVATIAGEIADHAARLLGARGDGAVRERLARAAGGTATRLTKAGLLADEGLIAECLARVQCEALAAALPAAAPGVPETPSLLVRLTRSPDRVVAAAAAALLAGESRRRAGIEGAMPAATGLPPALHQQLAWQVAAALRQQIDLAAAAADADADAVDRALTEATLRNLAAHDGEERVETTALRLAAGIDAQADELPALLDEALGDRRPILFAAFVAHALGAPYHLARELLIDRGGERLWLVLRALGLPRDAIARIGVRLAEADPRRDLDRFAALLDALDGLDPGQARDAVRPLSLHPEYRSALLALGRTS